MAKILAFGNPVYDDIVTPYIATDGRVLSGCSTNACIVLAHLGHQATLVGTIGADYNERFRADLRRYQIDAEVRPAAQTGGFRLVYDMRGDRTLDVLGIAEPIAQVPALAHDLAAVIIGPILQETPPALIAQVAAATSAPLVLDPQGLLRRIGTNGRIEHYAPAEFASIARLCRVVKANELETRVLTSIDPREDGPAAARALRATGCQIAIVTLAEAGSLIDDGAQQIVIPAYRTTARDSTGAGDTYMAGFIHSYLQNPADLHAAGCFASATASIWIEHTGPDAPISYDEIARRAQLLMAMT